MGVCGGGGGKMCGCLEGEEGDNKENMSVIAIELQTGERC